MFFLKNTGFDWGVFPSRSSIDWRLPKTCHW
jgi:hypothetical protein